MEILERDRDYIYVSRGSIEFSRSNFRHRYTSREMELLAGKKVRLNFVNSYHSARRGILMTLSRVHRCWWHPLSRLSRCDPLIFPQNNPPQTTAFSLSLVTTPFIPPVPSRASSLLPPLTFCRRWLLSRCAH